jgi:hypothetical protein
MAVKQLRGLLLCWLSTIRKDNRELAQTGDRPSYEVIGKVTSAQIAPFSQKLRS